MFTCCQRLLALRNSAFRRRINRRLLVALFPYLTTAEVFPWWRHSEWRHKQYADSDKNAASPRGKSSAGEARPRAAVVRRWQDGLTDGQEDAAVFFREMTIADIDWRGWQGSGSRRRGLIDEFAGCGAGQKSDNKWAASSKDVDDEEKMSRKRKQKKGLVRMRAIGASPLWIA